MELHSAAILEVWLRQSASWPRSRCDAADACGATLPGAACAAALAFLRLPMAPAAPSYASADTRLS